MPRADQLFRAQLDVQANFIAHVALRVLAPVEREAEQPPDPGADHSVRSASSHGIGAAGAQRRQ